jgi:hypothetical protein
MMGYYITVKIIQNTLFFIKEEKINFKYIHFEIICMLLIIKILLKVLLINVFKKFVLEKIQHFLYIIKVELITIQDIYMILKLNSSLNKLI